MARSGTTFGAWVHIRDMNTVKVTLLDDNVQFDVGDLLVTMPASTLDAWLAAAHQARAELGRKGVLDGIPLRVSSERPAVRTA